eukprot:TRINITY_DN1284_c0_g1_i1.p1 TRINITY_DN1284_c0_g1~~TRINITY_DN1284_c0_g1_i1.p1  ORF type:complete len:639 (-),score=104.11 TRINITY_DN1284_c0_g1_i1:61-1977(-)
MNTNEEDGAIRTNPGIEENTRPPIPHPNALSRVKSSLALEEHIKKQKEPEVLGENYTLCWLEKEERASLDELNRKRDRESEENSPFKKKKSSPESNSQDEEEEVTQEKKFTKLDASQINNYKVRELRVFLEERGLEKSGTKPILINRLFGALESENRREKFLKLTRSKSMITFLEQNIDKLTTCPKCEFVFEKVEKPLTRTPTSLLGPDGKELSTDLLRHHSENRFRCRSCSTEFCASCESMPYHLGLTCEERQENLRSRTCRYCRTKLPPLKKADTEPVNDDLCYVCHRRKAFLVLCDSCPKAYCLPCLGKKKKDLPTGDWFCVSCSRDCCENLECVEKDKFACQKTLSCGHPCSSTNRLPNECFCLSPSCSKSSQTSEDFCNICWVEDLASAPCLRLDCSHIFHMQCLEKRLSSRWSGSRMSFNYIMCPLCNEPIANNCLRFNPNLATGIQWLFRVKELAVLQLSAEGLEDSPELKEGGKFFENKVGYGLDLFSFYLCHACNQPFYGGRRLCDAGEAPEVPPNQLLCPQCINANCIIHGTEFIEYACLYCCSVATYHCGGNYYCCTPCHSMASTLFPKTREMLELENPCPGLDKCPLKILHPRGEKFALGCGMCKHSDETKEPSIRIEESAEISLI